MLKLVAFVIVGAMLAGCSADQRRELEARAKAVIDARRIPEVELKSEQVALLKKPADNSRIVWGRAGRQADGKTFVCYVTSTPIPPNIFGQRRKDIVMVHAGAFGEDGSFKESAIPLLGEHGFYECHDKGIDPPVIKVRRNAFE